jgi:2-polyprenyl-3-methyl-5-hydroxy-6-metoxy-1,4-benzoquinol methylase
MDPEYALRYREIYEKHWWWRAREKLILSAIEKIHPKGSRGSILDIGCGDGLLFDRLSAFGDVEGVEMDGSLVSASSSWKDRIYVCSFDGSFRPGKQYSLILMLDVLEHFSDPVAPLRRALALLDQEGILLITVPAFRCLWTSHDELNRHFTRYTKRSFIQVAKEAGMKLHSCRYFFHWTFPVKLLIRTKEVFINTSPQTPKIPPYWINTALYKFSTIEQKVFHTLPVPFGTSLICLGSKR